METPWHIQQKVSSPNIVSTVSTDPDMHHSFCTFQPLTPKEALEERVLLDSIAWPEIPPLPAPISIEHTSDPAHSTFTILPRRGGGKWQVGDQLEVMIKMSDFQGRPKTSPGDFLLARMHNQKLGAGVAGKVVDHLNGSYSAVFSLLWDGEAHVEVTLVHPGEAIAVLIRMNKEEPDRIKYNSIFHSGSLSESTICDVCLRPTQQPLCNFTDFRTGDSWFCYKPQNLSCDTRIIHNRNFNPDIVRMIKPKEDMLFKSGVNMKVFIGASGPDNVTVLPKNKDHPEVKSISVTSAPSGYYYQGLWRALGNTTVRQINMSAASQCLKFKMVRLYGDSTIRQWFGFFMENLPGIKQFDLQEDKDFGPFMAVDHSNNILVTYRYHGPPIFYNNLPTSKLRYIANELDDLTGGANTVVAFGIWAHFTHFPMEVYIRRLLGIRRAVMRLLDRAPRTLVIIRTGNPRSLTLHYSLIHSDWYSMQRNKVLRALFTGLNVHWIDAWEMAVAHHLPHSLHPQTPIVMNMIDILLSHICPKKSG
ncbi:NXPE family member 3-like [Cottoperca gobio]|uniref:NXPE family member 3-like n=1 Tax=Cottoperca gobio TaxID=56716 RepID=A0A6J2PS51_COTGO|nr:NXPE family member 3-like [Cottoperca gobio]